MPGAPGGGPGAGMGGIMLDFRRLETAKTLLQIDWTFPVHESEADDDLSAGRTTTAPQRVALSRDEAFRELRATDRRPLLVVRECGFCKGTEDALLSRRLDNEKTLIYSQWFRCLKLPNHVLEADHPYRNLFDTDHPPHLFLCRYDGSELVAMDGQQTQSQLWAAMERLIGMEYRGDPVKAAKAFRRALDEFDIIDGLQIETRRQYEEALDDDGPRAPKARKLAKRLADLEQRRAKAEAKAAECLDLDLLPLPDADGGADAEAAERRSGSAARR